MSLIIGLLSITCIAVKAQRVKASGTIYIRADGSVEGTDKIQRDEDIYTFTNDIYDKIVVERSHIIIDGNGYTLVEPSPNYGYGFTLVNLSYVTITRTRIRHYLTSILVDSSHHINISENDIQRGSVRLRKSSYSTISRNNLTDCGIQISGSNHNYICGNYIADYDLVLPFL